MDETPVGVFVVTLEGVENGVPPPLTILAFAAVYDAAAAETVAVREAERDGFAQVRAVRTAEVIDAAAMPEDFRDALANARRYGSWLIVYEQP
ncbi:MAG: hypothetical protein JHD15_06655 [Phenylobacterium sp.]|uniref:hypothetical protein n=1 Tax=Phenylobacterium sp. TaxID=1871053 RepID=UPI001A3344BB|nr:hypothetical protein [Phenylobacterium sp.]MBJ7410033.1 hypothetical protein [Phenylobacterium sp.]